MPTEGGNGSQGDRTGAHHIAPQTDRFAQRLGRFTDHKQARIAVSDFVARLSVSSEAALIAQATEQAHTAQPPEHLIILSGGHVQDMAMSRLLLPHNLHRIGDDHVNDYVYVTTAEELADTITYDVAHQDLNPNAMLHLVNGVMQEVGTAAQYLPLLTRGRQDQAQLYRESVERGLQTGESMIMLYEHVSVLNLPLEETTTKNLFDILTSHIGKIKKQLGITDQPSH